MKDGKIDFNKPNIERSRKEYSKQVKQIQEGKMALEKSMVVTEKSLETRIQI